MHCSKCKCINIYEIRFESYTAVESCLVVHQEAGNTAPELQSQLMGQSFYELNQEMHHRKNVGQLTGRVNVSIWQVM